MLNIVSVIILRYYTIYMKEVVIPSRSEVPESDKWDLTTLFKSDKDWEDSLAKIEPLAKKFSEFQGKLGSSPEVLLQALSIYEELWKTVELVGNYAGLLQTADESDEKASDMDGRATMATSKAVALTSFAEPEFISIDSEKIQKWLESPDFDPYRICLQKLLRMKEHVLSDKEERILALQMETAQTAGKTFSLLSNVDLDFGTVTENGIEKPLTQSTWSEFLENKDRNIRKTAYQKFYGQFEKHQNTIASLYAGSVNQDIFQARARGYSSSLEASLFCDKVPASVYHNLIDTVHKNLPALHKYYSLTKKVLGVSELRHYDVYVPLVEDIKTNTPYDQAVEICRNALKPLGTDYTDILCNGLKNGWVDRYENKGKRSGAFSSGAYTGYPYILLNYKDSIIRDVFTMAHEGGHSMHSWYSAHNNPFLQYSYTIFEAEVASTFNEELVFQYLLKNADSDKMKAYLLSMRAHDILSTLHRQTMFAEFELKAHEMVENGTPLSAPVLRKLYRSLLEQYFGPEMVFEENSDLEGLRIPHFYNAFYVYKYSTGISAALALADRVVNGGESEKEDYYKFLKSGGSRYPIESLKVAGVNMESTEPVQSALDKFAKIVDELEIMLKK